jgi:hypothetical protein
MGEGSEQYGSSQLVLVVLMYWFVLSAGIEPNSNNIRYLATARERKREPGCLITSTFWKTGCLPIKDMH